MSAPRRSRALLPVVATVVVLAAAALVVRSMDDGGQPAADEKLAARIRATGVTPYLVDLDGAEVTDVRFRDDRPGLVLVDYDGDDGSSFTLALSTSEPGDLCGPGGSGEDEDGGSCTSDGDRASTEFEEMGTFTVRKAGTELTIDTVIESDPGLPERAFTALDEAREVSADELARYRGSA